MASATPPCLQTIIQNTSGKTLFIDFIPPHGKQLLAGQDAYIDGDLVNRLLTGGGRLMVRKMKSLYAALAAGLVSIVLTPAVYLYDPTLLDTKVVELNNGTLSVGNSCFDNFTGSS